MDEVENGDCYQFSVGRASQKVAAPTRDCSMDCVLGAGTGCGSSHYNRGYFGVENAKTNDLTLSPALPIYFGQ